MKEERTPIMKPKEIADYLGIHIMTVYRLAKTHKLPVFKVGGSLRAHKAVLDQILGDKKEIK